MKASHEKVQERVKAAEGDIIRFMREICAIPSMEGQIGAVGERIIAEMKKLGFEEARFDKMGNTVGRIGKGRKVIVYDSHIDTVSIGDPASWEWDPFTGKVEDGILYARGASDEKASTPGMVYGLAIARDLGLLDDWCVYYFGNMEEQCDGIAPNTFVEVDPKVKPNYVVIGEPTMMRIYRGHKGRVELRITAKGKSAHAALHYLGDNAIYKMATIITNIRDLDFHLPTHPFLGKATVAATDVKISTASINAVPDGFTIFIDRRMTLGEEKDEVIQQIKDLVPGYLRRNVKVKELYYNNPSYTGFTFPVDKYFPTWVTEESHPIVTAGKKTRQAIGLKSAPSGKWNFSTNGIYWAGKARIPCIGFGPGNEEHAHTSQDQVPLDDVVKATEFYAMFPSILREQV
jgi:putative selenium metabolism hydrolase